MTTSKAPRTTKTVYLVCDSSGFRAFRGNQWIRTPDHNGAYQFKTKAEAERACERTNDKVIEYDESRVYRVDIAPGMTLAEMMTNYRKICGDVGMWKGDDCFYVLRRFPSLLEADNSIFQNEDLRD